MSAGRADVAPVSVEAWEEHLDCMEWVTRQHTMGEIDRAGEYLAFINDGRQFGHLVPEISENYRAVLEVAENWRSAHARPLQTAYMTLRQRAQRIQPDALVVQRMKRRESIIGKLSREPKMKLSQMQDLGGCRAVVSAPKQLHRLSEAYSGDQYRRFDYVSLPKSNGYRSIHFICRYKNGSKKPHLQSFVGQRVEVQIRTQMQHSWATAVETVSTFTQQSLKSNVGEDKWKRFFLLCSAYMADLEGLARPADVPADTLELATELLTVESELRVVVSMEGWKRAMEVTDSAPDKRGTIYLLVLNTERRRVRVMRFPLDEFIMADIAYTEAEEEAARNQNIQTVLVSASSIAALKRAYPNFYADTSAFIKTMRKVVS